MPPLSDLDAQALGYLKGHAVKLQRTPHEIHPDLLRGFSRKEIDHYDFLGKEYFFRHNWEEVLFYKVLAGLSYRLRNSIFEARHSFDRAGMAAYHLRSYDLRLLCCSYVVGLQEIYPPLFGVQNRAFAQLRLAESFAHVLRYSDAREHLEHAKAVDPRVADLKFCRTVSALLERVSMKEDYGMVG